MDKESKAAVLSGGHLMVLGAAFTKGEYLARREYNSPWGDDYAELKELEAMGLMEFVTFHRNPATKDFSRKSRITDAGKVAWREVTSEPTK